MTGTQVPGGWAGDCVCVGGGEGGGSGRYT